MPRFTPEQLFEHYNDFSLADKAEFKRLVKKHESFKQNLNGIAKAMVEHGPDAVMLAMQGKTAEARAASAAYRQAQPPKPQPEK